MRLPFFDPAEDPGSSFARLTQATNNDLSVLPVGASSRSGEPGLASIGMDIPHGTTCVAVRFSEGVVIAGDRRATAGNLISHRTIEKVFQTDRHSSVAIAGAAGPAVEMVKLFQLQLEHYEKVEGRTLSLEGKANQLSQMLRGNLPMAMRGLAVVPIFAGYDLKRGTGRLFQFDVTGGRYEERDYAVTGSGSLHAGTVIKVGYRFDQTEEQAIDLVINALFEAADADSATGLPDMIRNIFPVIATITEAGFSRLDDEALGERYDALFDELRQRGLPN